MIKNNILQYFVISALLLSSLIVVQNNVSAAVLPDLGTAIDFAVISDAGVTNTGATVITGDVGLHPNISITGFPPGVVVGTIHNASDTGDIALDAKNDAQAAFEELEEQTCTNPDSDWPGSSGVVLTGVVALDPGVYCSTDTIQLAVDAELTLDGPGLYIFKADTAITTFADSNVLLDNGATAENVFWRAGSAVTLAAPTAGEGGTSVFQGTVIAGTEAITTSGGDINTTLEINGRLISLNAAVTFVSTTIVTVPVPVDDTAPTLAITSDPTSPSDSTSSLEFTFEFSEDVTGFTVDDITLDFAGTGAAAVDGSIFATTDANTYTLTLANQDLADLQALTSGQTVVASVDMTGLASFATTNPGSGTEDFTWTFDDIIAPPPPSDRNGSSNDWATKPTFGVSYETNKQFVTDGFGYNVFAKTITDNFNTGFAMVDIPTDTSYPLYAKGYFAHQLKIQEFCFGIPEAGKGHLAESCIEVHFDSGYDSDRKIANVKVIQDSNAIDAVSVQHEMANCNPTDTLKACDKTMITIAFAEPLQHSVMMIKGIDWKGRSTETYLNDGFNVNGKQLTDLPTAMIPSPTKYEGLIKVTQSEKYSDIWISDDKRMFERNDFGSFNQVNQTYERHQDTGDMKNRIHSAFAGWKEQQAIKAKNIWDASKYVSTLPPSFIHDYPVEDSRTTFLKEHNMLEFARGQ